MTQELKDLLTARARTVQGQYYRHGRVVQAVWLVAAILVIVAGLAMTVLPGPAIVVIPLGIAMLAARFRWAERLLAVVIDRGVSLQRRANRAAPATRAIGLAVVLGIGVLVAELVLR